MCGRYRALKTAGIGCFGKNVNFTRFSAEEKDVYLGNDRWFWYPWLIDLAGAPDALDDRHGM